MIESVFCYGNTWSFGGDPRLCRYWQAVSAALNLCSWEESSVIEPRGMLAEVGMILRIAGFHVFHLPDHKLRFELVELIE